MLKKLFKLKFIIAAVEILAAACYGVVIYTLWEDAKVFIKEQNDSGVGEDNELDESFKYDSKKPVEEQNDNKVVANSVIDEPFKYDSKKPAEEQNYLLHIVPDAPNEQVLTSDDNPSNSINLPKVTAKPVEAESDHALPTPTEKPKEQAEEDCTTNADQNTQNKDAINRTFALFGEATDTPIAGVDVTFNTYQDFLDVVAAQANNPEQVEYSVTLVQGGYGLRFTEIHSAYEALYTPITISPDMITIVHNHTRANAPPSAGDLFLTARLVAEGYKKFESSITYDPYTEGYYILYVEDREKAKAFYENYGDELGTDGWFKRRGEIYEHIIEIEKSFEHLDDGPDEFLIYLLTTVLDNFDSGMKLLKQTSDKKLITYGIKKDNNKEYITPIKCTE